MRASIDGDEGPPMQVCTEMTGRHDDPG
jgi:hypothetical protein